MLHFAIPLLPELDTGFVPAALWNQAYRQLAEDTANSRAVRITLERAADSVSVYSTRMLPATPEYASINRFYLERLVKFLLWAYGWWHVTIAGADELVPGLQECYAPTGARAFDYGLFSGKYYRRALTFDAVAPGDSPAECAKRFRAGGHRNGCRIGFDLGGSDRKCAAVIDGEVVFTEEVAWSPYFESDPGYHVHGIMDSLRRAAGHLPRVEAIGGSAAGVYADNRVCDASLFRGIAPEDFERDIRDVFHRAAREFGDVPLAVFNDGEVTALAGALNFRRNRLLGVALGTSEAVGYVDENGCLTDYLNELAFAPIDYRQELPWVDEWSQDAGVGSQFLSQQAVGRLATRAGLGLEQLPLPEQLATVQQMMAQQVPEAKAIFRTIGAYLGYALAHYAEFYDLEAVLLLGRVTSGAGGEVIRAEADRVLEELFPTLKIALLLPDETFKRHGQAVVAAGLPEVKSCC